ncbi:MAG: TIGR02099 family protein, partial [Pseudomonadota bacterium]|nr:TIGR02099 family protein [Pseudomonadota bacterium]
PLPKGIQGWLYDYQPKGQVNQLSLNLAGRLNNLRLVNLNVRFKDFGIDPVNHRPGFNHLSGSLIMQKDSGNVLIDSRNVAFVWPEQWQKPLFFDTAVGRLSWKREGHDWQIATNGIHLTNSGLIASVTGTYRTDLQSPGYLDLHGDIQQCNAKDIPSYLPRSIGEPVITWLKSAIQAGQVKNATVLIQGNLQDFPFRVSSQGRFMAQAHVTKGRLDYAPGWPSLNNLALDLRFNGTKMQIDGRSGNLYAGQLSNIKADIPDLFRPNPLLTVTGQAFAPTQDLLHFIWKSPINKMLSHIADGVVVRGNGRLNLTLFIPLGSAQPIHAAGTYQFINNEIQFPHHLPGLSSVNGVLNFTGTRAKASRLQAHMLGGPVSIDLDADTATGSKIRLTGLGQINQVLKWLNVPFRNYLSGMTPYQAKLEVSPDGSRNLSVKSRLVGITSRLPYPFSKTSDESVPFFIDNRISPLNQGRKISAQYGRHLLKLAWMGNLDGKTVQAKISFQKKLGRLPVSGIEVTGSLDRLNADAWRTLIPWHHGKPVLAFPSLHVHLELGLLEVAHHGFHHVKLNLVPTHEIWVAQVSSDELAGTIHYDSKGSGAVQANLTRLSLPIPSEVLTGTDLYLPHQSQIKSQELPTFNIQARNLILNTHHYGMMHLQATPHGQDWVINSLTLENKDSKLYLKGKWDDMSNLSHSEANFTLDVHDIGHYLSRIGHPNLVRGGKAKLTGQLTWNGPLTHLDYPSLTGKLSLTADKGQFLKADPGIGKLLGILSLQALPGRFALDFHDIFSHGFAFDTIQSNLVVNKGVLQTDDFRMYGPSALVLMSGQTDLNHETQRINVHVIPNVGNSISVGAAFLGGPVVGLTSLLLQKLLKDPVGRIVSYHYLITGDWDKPLVKRVSAAKASQGSGVAN